MHRDKVIELIRDDGIRAGGKASCDIDADSARPVHNPDELAVRL